MFNTNSTNTKQQSKNIEATFNAGLRTYLIRVFNYMVIGLLLTGAAAMYTASNPDFFNMLYGPGGTTSLGMVVTFSPFVVYLVMSFGSSMLSAGALMAMFLLFSTLMGLSSSMLFVIYTGESIAKVFFMTTTVFAGMSLYGYTTKKDLTNFGSMLMMGLFGMLIITLANMFLIKSTMLMLGAELIILFIFIGLVAYNIQKLKYNYYQVANHPELLNKMSIYGALTLYVDFINIFIRLLMFFGNRRD